MYKIYIYIIYSCCKTSVLKVVFAGEKTKQISLLFPSDGLFFASFLPTFSRGNRVTIRQVPSSPATHLPKHG